MNVRKLFSPFSARYIIVEKGLLFILVCIGCELACIPACVVHCITVTVHYKLGVLHVHVCGLGSGAWE